MRDMKGLEDFEDVVARLRAELSDMTLNRPAPFGFSAQPRRRPRAWWALAGALVVAIAVIPAGGLLTGSGPVETTSASTLPEPAFLPDADGGWIDWQALNLPGEFDPLPTVYPVVDRWMAPVTPGGGPESASGYWTSSDAVSWTFVAFDPTLFGMTSASLEDVAAFDGVYYAIARGEPIEPGTADAVVIRSEDGSSWLPVDKPAVPTRPLHLAAGSSGVIVMSRDLNADNGRSLGWTISTSTDGQAWTSTSVALTSIIAPRAAVTDDGFYIGDREALTETAAMWYSDNGSTWTRLPIEGDPIGHAEPFAAQLGLVARISDSEGLTQLYRLDRAAATLVDATPHAAPPTFGVGVSPDEGPVVTVDDSVGDAAVVWSNDLDTWHRFSLRTTVGSRHLSMFGVLNGVVLLRTYEMDADGQSREHLWYRGSIRQLPDGVSPASPCEALIGDEPWLVLFTDTYPGTACVRVGIQQNIQVWNKGFSRTIVEWNGSRQSLGVDQSYSTGVIGTTLSPGIYTFTGTPYQLPQIEVVDPSRAPSAGHDLTSDGWGPVTLGMTVAQATDALGEIVANVSANEPGCWLAGIVGDPYTPIFTAVGNVDDTAVIVGITTTYPEPSHIGSTIDPDHGTCPTT